MKIASVTAHRHKECHIPPEKWEQFTQRKQTDEWIDDELFGRQWISPTCLLRHPGDGLVYVGVTALDGDIFYAFDPRTGEWESLDFPRQDRYATKIHQSLEMDDDGFIYGAVATLSDVDAWPKAPGGQLFRFDPRTRRYEFLGIPLAHDYIQGIVLDRKRGVVYGDTFPGYRLFRYDLKERAARELAMLGAVSTESLVLDADGGLWHHYALAQWAGRYPLLRYDPELDQIEYLNLDLPETGLSGKASGQMDSAVLASDGSIYMGTMAGALVRLNSRERRVTYLGKPVAGPRLKGLLEGQDGRIYGVAGAKYGTHLVVYDPASGRCEDLGGLVDSQDGTRCWLAHHLCQLDANTFLVAECDNHERASFLYQVRLAS